MRASVARARRRRARRSTTSRARPASRAGCCTTTSARRSGCSSRSCGATASCAWRCSTTQLAEARDRRRLHRPARRARSRTCVETTPSSSRWSSSCSRCRGATPRSPPSSPSCAAHARGTSPTLLRRQAGRGRAAPARRARGGRRRAVLARRRARAADARRARPGARPRGSRCARAWCARGRCWALDLGILATDWGTVAEVGTALGTLVLAIATFLATRTANRASRVAEQALLISLRPVLVPSREGDPSDTVLWGDAHQIVLPGGYAWAEVQGDNVYLAISLRNVGSGLGALRAWCVYPQRMRTHRRRGAVERRRLHATGAGPLRARGRRELLAGVASGPRRHAALRPGPAPGGAGRARSTRGRDHRRPALQRRRGRPADDQPLLAAAAGRGRGGRTRRSTSQPLSATGAS